MNAEETGDILVIVGIRKKFDVGILRTLFNPWMHNLIILICYLLMKKEEEWTIHRGFSVVLDKLLKIVT